MIQKFLDVMSPRWVNSPIVVSSDGAQKITECHLGIVTYLHLAALFNFIQIWYEAYYLDLIM